MICNDFSNVCQFIVLITGTHSRTLKNVYHKHLVPNANHALILSSHNLHFHQPRCSGFSLMLIILGNPVCVLPFTLNTWAIITAQIPFHTPSISHMEKLQLFQLQQKMFIYYWRKGIWLALAGDKCSHHFFIMNKVTGRRWKGHRAWLGLQIRRLWDCRRVPQRWGLD